MFPPRCLNVCLVLDCFSSARIARASLHAIVVKKWPAVGSWLVDVGATAATSNVTSPLAPECLREFSQCLLTMAEPSRMPCSGCQHVARSNVAGVPHHLVHCTAYYSPCTSVFAQLCSSSSSHQARVASELSNQSVSELHASRKAGCVS